MLKRRQSRKKRSGVSGKVKRSRSQKKFKSRASRRRTHIRGGFQRKHGAEDEGGAAEGVDEGGAEAAAAQPPQAEVEAQPQAEAVVVRNQKQEQPVGLLARALDARPLTKEFEEPNLIRDALFPVENAAMTVLELIGVNNLGPLMATNKTMKADVEQNAFLIKWAEGYFTNEEGMPVLRLRVSKLLEYIQKFPNARTLAIGSYERIGSDYRLSVIAEAIQHLSRLEFLYIRNQNFENRFQILARSLQHCTRLLKLDLQQCSLHNSDAIELANLFSSCKNLQILNVKLNSNLFSESARLGEIQFATRLPTSIVSLNLEGTNFSIHGLNALLQRLPACRHVRELKLSENHFGNEGAAVFAQMFPLLENLEVLELNNTDIEPFGAAELSLTLGRLTHLKVLSLDRNNISASGAFRLGNGPLGGPDALKLCTELRSLSLSQCNLQGPGVESIVENLRCPFLEKLDLSFNDMKIRGATSVRKLLQRCHNLKFLKLGGNELGNEGVALIADGLQMCQNLEELSLVQNEITEAGMAALVQTLPNCTKLKFLNLSSNYNLGEDVGGTELTTMTTFLPNLQNLEHLYLNRCSLSHAQKLLLHQNLPRLKTLSFYK